MIIKGGPRAKGAQLAVHLMRTDTNETVRMVSARGVSARTVMGALQEMEGIAAGSKATKPLYHVSINPESDERLSLEQWTLAADRLEKALGLEGHQRVMVQHLKQGKGGDYREHMHVCWCRIDVQTMKAAHHSHNYRTHEEVARSLEREFGLRRTQGVHAELDGQEKPEKRLNTKESMQEAVTGWKKSDAKAMIAAAWNASRNGAAFRKYLDEAGYRLAAGDKRDFVVIDPAGGVHSIRSGVNRTRKGEKGLTVAEVRERFADLDLGKLPRAGEAQEAARASYAAFLVARDVAKQKEAAQPVPPVRSVRPPRPEPGRYNVLRAQPRPPASRPVASTAPISQPPRMQYTPTPPSWARAPEPAPTKSPPLSVPASAPVSAPVSTSKVPSPPKVAPEILAPSASQTAQDLKARQDAMLHETLAQIKGQHATALRQLDDHHGRRLAGLTADVDARLQELNGLGSRMGALFDKSAHDREIAYLVAKRQRSIADETARQDRVKEDLRRAHERELAEAKAKHDRLAALQQKVLEDAEARRQAKIVRDNTGSVTPRRPPELDR